MLPVTPPHQHSLSWGQLCPELGNKDTGFPSCFYPNVLSYPGAWGKFLVGCLWRRFTTEGPQGHQFLGGQAKNTIPHPPQKSKGKRDEKAGQESPGTKQTKLEAKASRLRLGQSWHSSRGRFGPEFRASLN